MPIFHKNRQNLQSAKTDKSQQILQGQTTENHSIFCQNLENAVEPKTKKSAFSATKKSTPINKKHPQKNLTSNQTPTPAPRKKFLKIFAAASLALITCATTLLATAPFGTGAANAATESEMTAQEQLAAGTLNLNPDTDPTIYTTESGLDIKFGGATLESGALSGYTYFTLGAYEGTPVNWVIIGRSPDGFAHGNTTSIRWHLAGYSYTSQISSWLGTYYETSSPAGKSLLQDGAFDDRIVGGTTLVAQTLEVISNELSGREVLVISETVFGAFSFPGAVSIYHTNYEGSYVQDGMEALCNGTTGSLGFSKDTISFIVPQTLNNYHTNGTSTSTNQYLFPLAARGEKFTHTTYLSSNNLRIANMHNTTTPTNWWTRSGGTSQSIVCHYVSTTGTAATNYTGSYAIRPCFVLNIA